MLNRNAEILMPRGFEIPGVFRLVEGLAFSHERQKFPRASKCLGESRGGGSVGWFAPCPLLAPQTTASLKAKSTICLVLQENVNFPLRQPYKLKHFWARRHENGTACNPRNAHSFWKCVWRCKVSHHSCFAHPGNPYISELGDMEMDCSCARFSPICAFRSIPHQT